ncbi:MAG: L,D-transpeptidase family protein [Planctomycetaceae bacterium]|nr:L,D-transpeptidase family protein [Planctomycetaceae bacterium]
MNGGWFRSAIFFAVVFGIGLSLGFAWKSGWIPIELSLPKTGSLPSDSGTAVSESGGQSSPHESAPEWAIQQTVLEEGESTEPVELGSQSEPPVLEGNSNRLPPRKLTAEQQELARPLVSVSPVAKDLEVLTADRDPAEAAEAEGTSGGKIVAANATSVAEATAPRRPVVSSSQPEPDGTPTEIATSLAEADRLLADSDYLGAHRILSKLYWNHPTDRDRFFDKLEETAQVIFLSSQPHFLEPYVVDASDRLEPIARKYQLSWQYLAKLNRVSANRIREGQRLKVIQGPFAAVVDRQDYSLTIHLKGYFVKRYPVGIGRDNATPTGKFSVLNKVENPQYTDPDGRVIAGDDPANPLGERWIDLGESYGIHGTIEPESIGRAASRGCIRLGQQDVIEVYDFLVNGSEVVIR